MMGSKGIYFNVRPDWGGGEKVYLVVGPDGQGCYGQSGPVLRYQERNYKRDLLHQLVRDEPFVEIPLDGERYQKIISLAEGVRVPLLAESFQGYDGGDLALMIRNGAAAVEFRWWVSLPKAWEAELRPLVAALWELITETQASSE